MEIRVILRGALSGFVAGVLGFVFAWIFAEPVISKAIAYESGRDDILAALNHAAGRPIAPGRAGDLLPDHPVHHRHRHRDHRLRKYPANPPAIGHTFTITTLRSAVPDHGGLLADPAGAGRLARAQLAPRFGMVGAVVLAAVAFLVVYGVLIGLLPSLGNLVLDPQPAADLDGRGAGVRRFAGAVPDAAAAGGQGRACRPRAGRSLTGPAAWAGV